MDHVTTVRNFFAAWEKSYEDLRAAFVTGFTEEGVWVAGPAIPATSGGEAAAALMDAFHAGYNLCTIRVELLKVGQSDNLVWSERIDHLLDSTGKTFISLPVVGVMTMTDGGLIADWTDYWDRAEFDKLTSTA